MIQSPLDRYLTTDPREESLVMCGDCLQDIKICGCDK